MTVYSPTGTVLHTFDCSQDIGKPAVDGDPDNFWQIRLWLSGLLTSSSH